MITLPEDPEPKVFLSQTVSLAALAHPLVEEPHLSLAGPQSRGQSVPIKGSRRSDQKSEQDHYDLLVGLLVRLWGYLYPGDGRTGAGIKRWRGEKLFWLLAVWSSMFYCLDGLTMLTQKPLILLEVTPLYSIA